MAGTNNMDDFAVKKKYRSRYADPIQAEVYKKFPSDSFLGNETNVDHFMHWVTFFRRNMHRFATDYLGIRLHLYQVIMLYLMGVSHFFVVVASRASAKSFIIALYACIKCILYPNCLIVLASSTKGQSKLLVSEKIQKELMNMSPQLRKAIVSIRSNQQEVVVTFRNNSSITVVPASENGRGYRSNVIVREEFRQIKKSIDDSILSPFQIVRQSSYMKLPEYANNTDLLEPTTDIYISSSYYDDGTQWMWDIVDNAYENMLNGKPSVLLAFDESIAIKHGIKLMSYFQTEKKKQDPTTWEIEFLNVRKKGNQSAYFAYSLLHDNQRLKRAFYPMTIEDYRLGRKNQYDIPKQPGEIRIVACDMAFVENKNNDNSIYSCIRALPESTLYSKNDSGVTKNNVYRRQVVHMTSVQGGDVVEQALKIRRLFNSFKADYIVLDMRNAGISIYDLLARLLYDPLFDIEYQPLSCMNDDNIANRVKVEGANPCIFAINASQKLNSDIAMDFRRVLSAGLVDLLVGFEKASEEILPNIKEYVNSPDSETQLFYEAPFLETQALISETSRLLYDKNPQTGTITIYEKSGERKDRYTSVSYGNFMISMLERDMVSSSEEYEYSVLIN